MMSQGKKPKNTNPLKGDERLQAFGLFRNSIVERTDTDPRRKEIKRFIESFVEQIDDNFTMEDLPSLNYDLSAILTLVNDTDGKKYNKSFKHMPDRVLQRYEYLKKIILNPKVRSGMGVFDHVYWEQDKQNDILIIETHPYGAITDNDFEMFTLAKRLHPELSIEVLPNSYYFANHTLFIRFTINKASKFGREKLNQYEDD